MTRNLSNQNKSPRRLTAYVSILGTTQLHLRNPWIVAWWSIAFPGFGHLLLAKYLRGYILIGWELVINSMSNLNQAMVYSFTGKFELAKSVIDVRWLALYAPVYLFAVYDSYRTTIDLNNQFILANRERAFTPPFHMTGLEINYMDKRNPWLALLWSLLMPGMGQLYIHRIASAFYILLAWIGTTYLSHLLEGIQYTLLGDFRHATDVLVPKWLMFMPSIYCFALYDAYVNTVESNKAFDKEQRYFLKENYQVRKADHMRVISSFDHSIYLEMALTALEENGIDRKNILAVPLDRIADQPKKILDTMHRSDGISYIDTGIACATALTVIASSIGFKLAWGPIIWGLIGAVTGFFIGMLIDMLIRSPKDTRPVSKIKTEVVVLVDCDEKQIEMVENILWKHFAFGVAKLK
ncbi:hypothetical protein [Brevibacillus dissolubilis]|uniref:hypothetical protein n=1 Tax=Brevibacillus dissolubilis TaxID=1844116 RepID=UPI001116017A